MSEQLILIADDPTADTTVDREKVEYWYTATLEKPTDPSVIIDRGRDDDDEDDSHLFDYDQASIHFDACLLIEKVLAAVEDPVGAIMLDNAIAHLKLLMPKWMAWVLEL